MYPSPKPSRAGTVLSVVTVVLLLVLIVEVNQTGVPTTIHGGQIQYVTVVDTYVSTSTLYSTAVSTTTINGSYAQALSGVIVPTTVITNIPGVGTGQHASFNFTILAFFSHYYLKYSINGGDQSSSVGFTLGAMSGTLKGSNTIPVTEAFTGGPTYTLKLTGNDAHDTITFSINGATS